MIVNDLRRLKSRMLTSLRKLGTTPAWTSPEEQKFLTAYAKSEYTGVGEIVDLGCLLGATSIALAKGLRSNSRVSDKAFRIHSFDWFRWERAFQHHPTKPSRTYADGEFYYREFLNNIRALSRFIAPYPFDLSKQGWPGGPIEFIFADSTKSFALCEMIVSSFYTKLIPGTSLVCEQDFVHWWAPWIHLAAFRFRECLQPLRYVPHTTTYVFKATAEINPALVTESDLRACSDEEVDAAFEYCLDLMPDSKGWERSSILAAKATFYAHTDRLDRARELAARLLADGYSADSDISRASDWFEQCAKQGHLV